MNSYIQLTIRTKAETIDWCVGERLIDSLSLNGGLLLPDKVSNNPDKFTEPFEGKASCESVWAPKGSIRANGSLSDFHQNFAWKKNKTIKSTGSISHRLRNIRGQIVPAEISLRAACSDKVDWYALFKAWCEIFPPQIGMLHLFTRPELNPSEKTGSFQIGSFNAALKPDIPNIGWAMFYGDEFAQEVDADKIAASGFPIDRIGSGYLVRVTNSIQDVAGDFPLFSKRRAELKRLFREGVFLINHEPST